MKARQRDTRRLLRLRRRMRGGRAEISYFDYDGGKRVTLWSGDLDAYVWLQSKGRLVV